MQSSVTVSCFRCADPFEYGSYYNPTLHQLDSLPHMKDFAWLPIVLLLSVGGIESVQAAPASPSSAEARFPKPVEEYHDEQIPGIASKLLQRIRAEPFNLVGTLIFLGAIVHTFLASKFMLIAHRLEHEFHAL